MCDNSLIADQFRMRLAEATQNVDQALESVRAMRQAILAQMVRETADLRNIKVTSDDVAKAIKTIRKHNADTDRDTYVTQEEYMDLMTCKRQVEAIHQLVTKLENDPTGDAPVMSYKTAAYRIKLALEGAK